MNIFKYCQKEILKIIKENSEKIGINNSADFIEITIESPPEKFDCDLSTNIAMVLGKKNRVSPLDLAKKLSTYCRIKQNYSKKLI